MGNSHLSARALAEGVRGDVDRFYDLRLRWMAQDAQGNPGEEVLLDVGGRWDRSTKQWSGPGEESRDLGIHPGQMEAARWIVRWMEAKARGEVLEERGAPIYSLLLDGGRRGGKTDLGAKAGVAYAIMRPGSFVWLVSETNKKTEELQIDVLKWLHPTWFEYLGSPLFQFVLINGSVIWLRSAHVPERLKTGRCDLAVLNEAQLMREKAFSVVRAATADTGGITILCANPPEGTIGYWVERFREEAVAGKRQAKEFFLDATRNPHIDRASLEAMRTELSDREFRREILGEFLPREDVVFHGWQDLGNSGNIRPTPEMESADVTRAFTLKNLHRGFPVVLGIDLQTSPVCAVEARFFVDPEDPAGVLTWFSDTVIVENGDEEALSIALLGAGYDPKVTALIIDASGSWQGIDRKKKTPSFDLFKSMGWPHLYKPDSNQERNPRIQERVKGANGLFKNAEGKRRVFSDPQNLELNQALKLWENRNGAPYRRSPYAHLCDAATYILWRFFPRDPKPKGVQLKKGDAVFRGSPTRRGFF